MVPAGLHLGTTTTVALMASTSTAAALGLDVRGWLDRPGVELLAAE